MGVPSPWRKFRVTPEEELLLREGAQRYATSVSGFIRRAVKAALTGQPLLTPDERAAIDAARDQFRRAAVNLDSLLRQVYLVQSGVMDRGPSEDEFRFMLSDLRLTASVLKRTLRKLP
jgi:hypothetical protein